MRERMKELAVLLVLAASASVYMGCATMIMTELAPENKARMSKKRVLTDTIVALGKPDAASAKALGREDCIAFIGKAHTYMLHEGGQALWEISQLKLDGKRMTTDGATSESMFMVASQVWGTLTVTYDGGTTLLPEEAAELTKGGFVADSRFGGRRYRRTITISGRVLPAINSSTVQMPKLQNSHRIAFYATEQHPPNPLVPIAQVAFVVVGVAADVVLLPVYIIAIVGLSLQ
jgi:hypothetical protein